VAVAELVVVVSVVAPVVVVVQLVPVVPVVPRGSPARLKDPASIHRSPDVTRTVGDLTGSSSATTPALAGSASLAIR